jgi:hypothetical protein
MMMMMIMKKKKKEVIKPPKKAAVEARERDIWERFAEIDAQRDAAKNNISL